MPAAAMAAAMLWSPKALAQGSKTGFDQWVAAFRARAHARGISDATYTRVMSNIKPDTAVFELQAVRNFQRKVGMEPGDGYAGMTLLARLRQGL
jgi:membrane-bound lytic murein transglycosylase B